MTILENLKTKLQKPRKRTVEHSVIQMILAHNKQILELWNTLQLIASNNKELISVLGELEKRIINLENKTNQ